MIFQNLENEVRGLHIWIATKDAPERPRFMTTADTKVVSMTIRSLSVAILSLVIVASAAVQASAASVLALYYDPDTGNVKLQNTTSGSLPVQGFNVITLGDGTLGDPSGRPSNIGWLSGVAANLPAASFTLGNTSAFGYNGVNSQAYAENVGASMFTLDPYAGWSEASPIGPAGTFWDLGNIAATGMTQAELGLRFLTDPELTPPNFDATSYGNFLFTYQVSPGNFSSSTLGDVKSLAQPVPEPSTYAMLISAVACGGWTLRRKRKSA